MKSPLNFKMSGSWTGTGFALVEVCFCNLCNLLEILMPMCFSLNVAVAFARVVLLLIITSGLCGLVSRYPKQSFVHPPKVCDTLIRSGFFVHCCILWMI